MKIFRRTRILILFTILFLSIPILSEGMPYWLPHRTKSTTRPIKSLTTSLPPRIATTVPQNKASIPENCPLVPKIYEMALKTKSKKEKANVEVLFKETDNKLRSVITPIIREFVYGFEFHSVKDECEFRILKEITDLRAVEIHPMTMDRFDVVLGSAKFTLERNNLTEEVIAEYRQKETYMNSLVDRLRRNYTNIVQYVVIMFLEEERETPVGGEWVLYKQD